MDHLGLIAPLHFLSTSEEFFHFLHGLGFGFNIANLQADLAPGPSVKPSRHRTHYDACNRLLRSLMKKSPR